MRACDNCYMVGLVHLGRALPANPRIMDRPRPWPQIGALSVVHQPDRVVAGRHPFHRDLDRLLFQLARGIAKVASDSCAED